MSIKNIILYELKFCFRKAPLLMVIETLASLVHGVSFVAVTYMTQYFFDTIAGTLEANYESTIAYKAAVLLGSAVIFNQIISGLENFCLEVLTIKISGCSKAQLYEKTSRLGVEFFESPKLMDELNKAVEGADYIIVPLFPIIGGITFYVAYFLGMGLYVFKLQPILIVLLILIFMPSMSSQYLKIKLFSRLEDESTPHRRKSDHYEECICGNKYLKETRNLSATGYFLSLYQNSLSILSSKRNTINRESAFIEMKARGLTLIGYFFIIVLLITCLLNDNITVGGFAAVFMSVDKLFGMMDGVVALVGEATQNLGLVKNYLEFLTSPNPTEDNKKITVKSGIELKNVYYKYPESQEFVLKNVTIKIKAGETVAIVGENGAGKTTLVRIICGLFQPTMGSVAYDNQNIEHVAKKNIYAMISAVFQNYQKYKMTLKENLLMGCPGAEKPDDRELYRNMKQIGLDLNDKKFTNGLDTMLSREFGGIELSGGQWQRVAIGRGLLKSKELIVLDEPTAAIDPFEENSLYHTFSELSKNKTALIVTHRLGIAKIADRIIVMNHGEVVESGTHAELIAFGGKYKEMFEGQAKWYLK